ncbi:MAG: putative peptidase family [Burkholderiaceae bacterium]|nr:putative peptidase family [Burkholderiaceae bacterium]
MIYTFAVYALPILLAITLHEAAHAYAAKYFGDLTAYQQGRMSLNPIRHIDPFGTILIPVVLFFVGSPFIFGYAKPVPVDFGRLRKPKRDMAWVALAGPAANLLMAFLWLVLSVILHRVHIEGEYLLRVAGAGVTTNLVLFAFNLFPLPPLDGGRIVVSLLPYRLAYSFSQIERYGFFIVLVLAYFRVIHFWMVPVMLGANTLLQLLVSPLNLLLR